MTVVGSRTRSERTADSRLLILDAAVACLVEDGYAGASTLAVQARAGERVATGAPLGRLGNSGNSAAPHLHVHVQRGVPDGAPLGGEPLWFTVEGRFLRRNDVLEVPG